MPKHRILSFKPQLRLEWRGQDGQNETEQPDHSASLGDSVTSSTRIEFSVHTARAPLGLSPSALNCRLHSVGGSRRRSMPMPRGRRPSTAALTRLGARKASEMVILTCRVLRRRLEVLQPLLDMSRHSSRANFCQPLRTCESRRPEWWTTRPDMRPP